MGFTGVEVGGSTSPALTMKPVLAFALLLTCNAQNMRPVIGCMAQPADPDLGGPDRQYLVSSYVQWLESAGAQVVPVLFNQSQADLRLLFGQLSGLLLPGGHCGTHGTAYGNASWQLLTMAKQANDAGKFFPVWGTCQGHEQLAQFGSGAMEPSILNRTQGTEGLIVALNLTHAGLSSRLLREAPSHIVTALQHNPITVNLHSFSALASRIEHVGSATHAFFRVVGTNQDVHGKEFVSLFEARQYPFYGSQFHPEKNAFEWNQSWEDNNTAVGSKGGAHSALGVATSQYFANFFVAEARRCPHRWNWAAPPAPLIYDFEPTKTSSTTMQQWEQCYVF